MADFAGQREGEEVQLVFQRHFLVNAKAILLWAVLIALGTGSFFVFEARVAVWVLAGGCALGALVFAYNLMLWHFSVHVVTDQRIRQIAQRGIFKRSVVDLGLDKIESISYQVPGLLGGILGYGTLLIQTHVGDMVITKVSRAEQVHNEIQKLLGNEIAD